MITETITQHVAVSDTMSPWTAGMPGTVTHQDAVPLDIAHAFLSERDVASEPLNWLRPAMPWDDPARTIVMDGESYTVVSDTTRQVIYSAMTDRVHNVPGDGYSTVQPSSLIPRAEAIVQASADTPLRVLAAVQLDSHGAEFALTVGTQDVITVDGVGAFVPCVVLGTSMNGTLSTYFGACSLQIVCYNTQAHALGEAAGNGTLRKVKHTRHSAGRLDVAASEVSDAIGAIAAQIELTTATMGALGTTKFTDANWSAFVSELAPITDDMKSNSVTRAERQREAWTELYKSESLGEIGTAWNALQAVNTAQIWGLTRGTRGDTNVFARSQRELLTGKLSENESDVYGALTRVLAMA